jgi:hypothetical protein
MDYLDKILKNKKKRKKNPFKPKWSYSRTKRFAKTKKAHQWAGFSY